jgi:hypothetical protein
MVCLRNIWINTLPKGDSDDDDDDNNNSLFANTKHSAVYITYINLKLYIVNLKFYKKPHLVFSSHFGF